MEFKKLNKRRKIYFCIFLFFGIIFSASGILLKDLAIISLGLIFLLECFDLFNDQIADDLIDNYANMLETTREINFTNLKIINKAIKENNTTRLKYITEILDSYIGKENENVVDKG